MEIILKRISCSKIGTHGVLLLAQRPLCLTLELPWRDNERSLSCIPVGVYDCVKYDGSRFRDVFYVRDVPGRSGILIHAGNSLDDTSGCILVGQIFTPTGLLNSRLAMASLNAILPDRFNLNIKGF